MLACCVRGGALAVLQALRKSFLALFTRKALSMYIVQQDGIIRK